MQLGACDFLVKPLMLNRLDQALARFEARQMTVVLVYSVVLVVLSLSQKLTGVMRTNQKLLV